MGEKEKRQRCSDQDRDSDSQGPPGEKNTVTHKHIKNWLNIGVFIELSYKAGTTQKWALISHDAYNHIYTSPHSASASHQRICIWMAQGSVYVNKTAFKTSASISFKASGSCRNPQ